MDVARLKTIPLFASFSEDDLRKIAPFAEEHSVGAGETIVREGDYSYDLMIIEEGNAEVRHDGQKIADLGPATSSARWACSGATGATPTWWPRRRCA